MFKNLSLPLRIFGGGGLAYAGKNASINDSCLLLEPSEQFVLVSSGSSIKNDSTEASQSIVPVNKTSGTDTESLKKHAGDGAADGQKTRSKRDDFLNDLESTIAVVSRRSRLKDLVMSSEVPAEDVDKAWAKVLDGVRHLLSDSDRVDEIVNEMLKSEPSKMQEELMSIASDSGTETSLLDIDTVTEKSSVRSRKDFLPISQQHQWDDLARDHTCLLCKELLSSPVVTNCSHSFCGACLADHMESISSSDIDVVHSCPTCSDPILFSTYERVLDDNIAKKVRKLSRCCMSIRWQDRRIKSMKNSPKKETKTFNLDTDKAIQIAIPIVAVVLVMLIVMM